MWDVLLVIDPKMDSPFDFRKALSISSDIKIIQLLTKQDKKLLSSAFTNLLRLHPSFLLPLQGFRSNNLGNYQQR